MRALLLVLLVGCAMGGKKSAMAPSHVQGTVAPPPAQASTWRDIVVTTPAESPEPTDVVAQADTTLHSGQSTSGTSASPPSAIAEAPAKDKEQLVVEAWVQMTTSNVGKTVDMIRARVEQSGGRMVSENVNGSESAATSASIEFRIPPSQATAVTTWLGTLGTINNKNIRATEVSKTLFDQELALKNLEVTMNRLLALAEKGGPIELVLKIEQEMTRVRGQIEEIKGQHRFLLDRVAYATITVSIDREGDEVFDQAPEARIYPGPMLTTLTLIDPGTRQQTRVGGGVSVQIRRYATFELSLFPRGDGGDSRAVLATFGTGLYSGYLGYGQRRYFNPYIGARVGYGYVSGDGAPVLAGEVGVELYKHKYLLVDTSVRAIAIMRGAPEGALQGTLGMSVPF